MPEEMYLSLAKAVLDQKEPDPPDLHIALQNMARLPDEQVFQLLAGADLLRTAKFGNPDSSVRHLQRQIRKMLRRLQILRPIRFS